MNTYTKIVGLSVLVLSAATLQAYTYTFNNKSDKDAEVQFKLEADIVAKFPIQTVKVPAHGTGSITIPEWWRAGLCFDLESVMIKFDGEFKKPWMIDGILSGDWFNHVVQNKDMPPVWKQRDIRARAAAQNREGGFYKFLCYNRSFDFTYTTEDTYPVFKFTP